MFQCNLFTREEYIRKIVEDSRLWQVRCTDRAQCAALYRGTRIAQGDATG